MNVVSFFLLLSYNKIKIIHTEKSIFFFLQVMAVTVITPQKYIHKTKNNIKKKKNHEMFLKRHKFVIIKRKSFSA